VVDVIDHRRIRKFICGGQETRSKRRQNFYLGFSSVSGIKISQGRGCQSHLYRNYKRDIVQKLKKKL
jgi:hypothetical protein